MKKLITTLFLTLCSVSGVVFAQTRIYDFCVQHSDRPLSVEDPHPVFSWKMDSERPGAAQSAYRLKVTRGSDGSLVWDSGKVSGGSSDGILYAGVALQTDMGYSCSLTVWDENDNAVSADTRFETGLMNPRIKAWKGAQWIGSKELKLDAASQSIFDIETDFRLLEGSSASLIFGADDFRLTHSFFNGYGVASKENYIRVELCPEAVNIYRVGYFPEDKEDTPLYHFPAAIGNEEHHLELKVEVSTMRIFLDTQELGGNPRRNFWEPAGLQMNIMGSGGNFPSFPNLCSVGFAAAEGAEAVFSDYQILNSGQSVDRVVYQRGTVEVHGGEFYYFDPSHGAETMLRSEFTLRGPVKQARLYASAMGNFRLYLNGDQVGQDWFTPGNSQYRENICYIKYDVTDMLRPGANALAAELSGGWFTGYMTFTAANFNFFGDYEALLSRLVVTYEDGSKENFVSTPDGWKVWKDGPVRLGSFFQGERYDARKELPGWKEPGFDDSEWQPALEIEQREWMDFDIIARYDEPVRVRETLQARRIMPVHDDHTYIYDMGVNMVGVPEIHIPEGWLSEGDEVILTYGEQVYPGLKGDSQEFVRRFGKRGRNVAGHLLYETNRAALDADFFTASGTDAVILRPRDTFRGYQYIQVYIPSHKGPLPPENVRGLVLSSCEIPTATYSAATKDGETGAMVNQLFRNIQRSQLGNFLTLPTDCPQRNERMGWTGDAQAYTRTGTYQAQVQNFFRQWMVSLRADQGVGDDINVPGGIGSTVPTYNKADDPSFADGTTWGAAVCQVPWQLYSQYGDTRIIEENMEAMMNWLSGMAFYKLSDEHPYLSSKASGLADHLALDNRTPPDLLNNAIYIHMMEVTAVMASAIGREDYADLLRRRHALAKADWNSAYVDSATGKTKGLRGKTVHTQASYATPLNFNVFSEENKAKAQRYLAELAANPSASGPTPEEAEAQKDIREDVTSAFGVLGSGNKDFNFRPYTITTGFSGTPNILPALSRGGYHDVAARMITCKDYASWLYPVSKGATSIWERWNSLDTAFSEPNQNSMNSFNHFALGAVGAWMMEYQLGITSGEEAGYKHFVLQPAADEPFTSLEGSYDSHYGRIRSAWEASDGRITLYQCTVPANTSATLYLPVSDGWWAEAPDGAKFQGYAEHLGRRTAVYLLPAGSWEFTLSRERKE